VRSCKISHKGLLDQLTSGLLYPFAGPKDSIVMDAMLFFQSHHTAEAVENQQRWQDGLARTSCLQHVKQKLLELC